MMRIPSAESLRTLGVHKFASEVELQRFIEDKVAPLCGLRIVSSSLRGGHLGFIDTTAIDADCKPVIVEYKLDRVGRSVVKQLVRYRQWLVRHGTTFAADVFAKWQCHASETDKPTLVAVGYRFNRDEVPTDGSIVFVRYGYHVDRTVWLRSLDAESAEDADWGGDPPPRFIKDAYLERHLATTTPAAREAFDLLRRRLTGAGLTEQIHGKNRVSYHKDGCDIEIVFRPTAIQCYFDADGEPHDPDGRIRRSEKRGYSWTCGLVGPSDVEPVARLLGIRTITKEAASDIGDAQGDVASDASVSKSRRTKRGAAKK